jgi:uncharacterized protein (TIGR00251 family)
MSPCFRLSADSLLLDLKAVPGASKSALAGLQGNRLRVKIAAAPEDGKANGELIAFAAALLGRPKRDITLVSGEKSRLKTLSLPPECLETLETFIKDLK